MTRWPELFLTAPASPVWLDATSAGVEAAALDALPWARVFDAEEALEGGAIANPAEQRQVGHYWLRDPSRAPTVALAGTIDAAREATLSLAARIRDGEVITPDGARFTDVVHIGIGGSQLGPALLVEALGDLPDGRPRGLPVHFLDNTDPDGIARVLGRLGGRLRTTLVVVISKSGSTPETRTGLALARRALEDARVAAPGHLVAITQEGSALDATAAAEGWLARLPLWPWVGGRYSLTSSVGLFTAALAGADAGAFLDGAAAMDAWTRQRAWRANPAALLVGCWFVAGEGRGERNLVALPYADRLTLLSRYLQQLVMESLGKAEDLDGGAVQQGITVYGNKGSTDQHAYVQQLRDGRDDALVHFVQVLQGDAPDPALDGGASAGDQLQGFLLGTRRALRETARPSITLTIPRVDEAAIGALVGLFERSVGMYATLVHVNAYDQPGVEAGKRAARDLLALAGRLHAAAASATSLAGLATALDADPVEVLYLAHRLALTGRMELTMQGLDAVAIAR